MNPTHRRGTNCRMEEAVILVLACSWALQGLVVVQGQIVSETNEAQSVICNQPPDQGRCLAYIPQYFYNATSQRCETFIYGGCPGNQNRFNSIKKCMETCNPGSVDVIRSGAVSGFSNRVESDETCLQEPDSGPCLAYMPQFFYNATSGKCETFVYGGCGGNLNRFDSFMMCQMKCQAYPKLNSKELCSQPPETGPCKAYLPQLFYDAKSHTCMPFIYGGCLGNDNRFDSLQMCLQTCHPEDSNVIIPLLSSEDPATKSTEICNQPMHVGPCKAYVPRYFYNSTSQSCEKFIYGGCDANANNFVSLRMCMLNCYAQDTEEATPFTVLTSKSTDICDLPAETGPCRADIPRYFYNSASKTCDLFSYGGCYGNQNNFVNKEACMKQCKN